MRERLSREGHQTGASSVTHGFQAPSALRCGLLVREQVRSNPSLHPTRYSGLRPLPRAGELKRWASWGSVVTKGTHSGSIAA
jgi:hypothetical protein